MICWDSMRKSSYHDVWESDNSYGKHSFLDRILSREISQKRKLQYSTLILPPWPFIFGEICLCNKMKIKQCHSNYLLIRGTAQIKRVHECFKQCFSATDSYSKYKHSHWAWYIKRWFLLAVSQPKTAKIDVNSPWIILHYSRCSCRPGTAGSSSWFVHAV